MLNGDDQVPTSTYAKIQSLITDHQLNRTPPERTQQIDESVIDDLASAMEKEWDYVEKDGLPVPDLHSFSRERFGLDEPYTQDALDQAYVAALQQVSILHMAVDEVFFDRHDNIQEHELFMLRASRLLTMVSQLRDYLCIYSNIYNLNSEAFHQGTLPLENLSFFNMIDKGKLKPIHSILLYLLKITHNRGYRHDKEQVYKQKVIFWQGERVMSRAWEVVQPLETLPYIIRKEENFEQWKHLTEVPMNRVVEYLRNSSDPEFPVLEKNRYRFSFQNGVFDISTNSWWDWDAILPTDQQVSCKYHDVIFDESVLEYMDAMDIPTPAFDSIFDYQKIPEEAKRWIYILLGRVLFPLKEHDDWEIMLFFQGLAGTGKTCIGKAIKVFFDSADVVILNPNMERRFGLEAIYDKLIWLCYEVTGDWTLHQANFQSMVSGEEISIARKFKTAITVEWKVPGIMMGNMLPPWLEYGNNLGRRLAYIPFGQKVYDMDPTLLHRIYEQRSSLLVKLVSLYRKTAFLMRHRDIWQILPEWFREKARDLKKHTQPLYAFIIDSHQFTLSPTLYMPTEEFVNRFKEWLATDGKKYTMGRDRLQLALEELGCKIEACNDRTYEGVLKENTGWILGLCPSNSPQITMTALEE